jgi:hypothetical protein
MNDHDRQLFLLIEELTDCGMVMSLQSTVDHWGREHTKRAIADGFAVIRRTGTDLGDGDFVPTTDAAAVVDHLRRADEYVIIAGPWAAIGPEDDPSLILRYAADDPDDLAEVRRRSAEKRAALWP